MNRSQLDFITPEQSLSLMSKRIGRALEETEREEALTLAAAVGYLPMPTHTSRRTHLSYLPSA